MTGRVARAGGPRIVGVRGCEVTAAGGPRVLAPENAFVSSQVAGCVGEAGLGTHGFAWARAPLMLGLRWP